MTDMEGMKQIYGSGGISAFFTRKKRLETLFSSRFSDVPDVWFSSSGRVEVIGNHTDHNGGKVIVGAITCDILAAVSGREDGVVEICAEEFHPIKFSLDDLSPKEGERGKSISLARGVAHALSRYGKLRGFRACTHGNIFRGAGVSSSAAFEVLVAEIFNVLSFDGRLTPMQKARAGQYAENVFFGKPCGLLDQGGIALGGLHLMDFQNAEDPIAAPLPPLKNYSLIMTNTGGSHAGLTKHYALIRSEMEAVASFFQKRVLCEVAFPEFLSRIPELRKKFGERAVLRALHFFEENVRVERAANALLHGDKRSFLAQVRKSGESSLSCLQNTHVAGSETQPVVLAMRLSERIVKEGAFRMQGGGFAGTVIAFLPKGEEGKYVHEMSRVFGKENVHRTEIRATGARQLEI